MQSPNGLARILADPEISEPVLLHSLTGFLDAGSAGRLAVASVLENLPHAPVAEFDLDVLYDYRARRPRMTFLTDHYGEIEFPRLLIERVDDLNGTPFLVLHGPEPDFRWRAFGDDVAWLAQQWQVALSVGMHAVPWPAPHTRPVNVTVHGNDPDLIGDRRPFVGDLEVPAHMAGLLELTMTAHDLSAMGFAAHVPHYLSAAEYPRASLALLEAVSAQTGLVFPLDDLRELAEQSEAELGIQVAGEAENIEAVRMLEEQYDDFMARHQGMSAELQEADPKEFVDEVERFLAEQEGPTPES